MIGKQTAMDLLKEASSVLPYMIDRRRWYHTWPELSGKEDNTIASISDELDAMGIRHTIVPDGGILGFIDGDTAGKTVLLRADVDGLPIREDSCNLKNPRLCISKNDGVSMMCGHDAHIAMLLGTAKILTAHRDSIKGRVILMFERGEESARNIGYLHRYMRQNDIEPDTCWGLHAYPALETGRIFIHPGPVMAGMISFHIVLTGRGGHGARPDAACSPIDCFTAVYDGISKLRLRCVSPFSPLTFSVGRIRSGERENVIPDDLSFDGSIRFFDTDSAAAFCSEMKRIIRSTAEAYGCTAAIDISNPCFPVYNDPECTGIAIDAAAAALGRDSLAETDPWMVSETMALSLKLWPGVFALLGIRNDDLGSGAENHSAQFDLDEDAMVCGAAATTAYALSYLEDPVETSGRKWKGSLEELYRSAGIPFCMD